MYAHLCQATGWWCTTGFKSLDLPIIYLPQSETTTTTTTPPTTTTITPTTTAATITPTTTTPTTTTATTTTTAATTATATTITTTVATTIKTTTTTLHFPALQLPLQLQLHGNFTYIAPTGHYTYNYTALHPTTLRSISGAALPSMPHNNQPPL